MTKDHQERSALFVMDGVKGGHDGMSYSNPKKFRKKKQEALDIKKLAEEVRIVLRSIVRKYRIYPNNEQEVFFAKCFGSVRFVYNRMLSEKQEYYKETGKSLKITPAKYKKEFPWLRK